jgi:hypothetical protein
MPAITITKVKSMKVADLRKELSDRGLNASGLKTTLVARLTKDIIAKAKVVPEVKKEEVKIPADKPKPTTLAGLLESIEGKAEDELTAFEKDVLLRKKRSEKFGSTFKLGDSELAAMRAARFGVQTAKLKGKRGKVEISPEDLEKMNKRAKRFGGVTKQSGIIDPDEQARREARAKRFE